ncbi:MAG: T9SS type A sorting domain-containing protein [Cyclobacteriaceae bacterium]
MKTRVLASSFALLFLLTLQTEVTARTTDPPPKTPQPANEPGPGMTNTENNPHTMTEPGGGLYFNTTDSADCPPLRGIPYGLASMNGTLFFGLDEPFYYAELWKIDGTTGDPQLVKDIRPDDASIPEFITTVGSMVYFRANDGVHGSELWKSDGTKSGTTLVKDIIPGSDESYPDLLTNVNGMLYFTPGFDTDRVLWKSDGTDAGTVPVAISALSGLTGIDHLSGLGSTLYFTAADGVHGGELWKTDGTEAGTMLVKDIYPGDNSSRSSELTPVGNTLYFVADDGVHGGELWKTDGTESGTMLVKDIYPGGDASAPNELTAVGNTLYFVAEDGLNGRELWKSDGTESGTMSVRSFYSGSGASEAMRLGATENMLYFFTTLNGVSGAGLWKSDGTAAGTQLVQDIYATSGVTGANESAAVNGTLYFVAYSDATYLELWQSDGTTEGTMPVPDCSPTTIENLELTAECSEDPATERAWRIINPNDFTVRGRYEVAGTSQSGSFTSSPGDTYFTTQTVAGPNTVTLRWDDEHYEAQTTTQTSDGASCEPTVTFPTTNGSCEIAVEDFPADLDYIVASAPATYADFTYHKRTYVVGIIAGMRTDGKPGAWEIHNDCTIKPMKKCVRNNDSELPNRFWSGLNYRKNWRFEVTGISPDGGTIYADAINDEGYVVTRRRWKKAGVPDIAPGTVVPISWKLSNRPLRGRIRGARLNYECDVTVYYCGGPYIAGCNSAARIEPIAKKGASGLGEQQDIIPWEEATLRLYPNPGQNHFTLDFTGGDQWGTRTQVFIYDLTGVLVRQQEIDVTQHPQYQMDITELSSGLYMVKIIGGELRKTLRIMKE